MMGISSWGDHYDGSNQSPLLQGASDVLKLGAQNINIAKFDCAF